MRLVVLNVAYPFAQVGPEATGEPERMLTQLDSALDHGGHDSIVIAREGSQVKGILLSTPHPDRKLNGATRKKTYEQYRYLMDKFLEKWPIDIIHMHGVDFHHYLPRPGVPVIITLHLPVHWYPPEVFRFNRPQTYLHCISADQREACPPCPGLLPETGNSVLEYFAIYERLVTEARDRERTSQSDTLRLVA
jgi:hypothetical protein